MFIDYMKTVDADKSITDVVMFNGSSNVQPGGNLLKIHDTKLTVMCVF